MSDTLNFIEWVERQDYISSNNAKLEPEHPLLKRLRQHGTEPADEPVADEHERAVRTCFELHRLGIAAMFCTIPLIGCDCGWTCYRVDLPSQAGRAPRELAQSIFDKETKKKGRNMDKATAKATGSTPTKEKHGMKVNDLKDLFPQSHVDTFEHMLGHISKAAGRLHGLVGDADHIEERLVFESENIYVEDGRAFREAEEANGRAASAYIADLVIFAAKLAALCPSGEVDLEQAVADRMAEKRDYREQYRRGQDR